MVPDLTTEPRSIRQVHRHRKYTKLRQSAACPSKRGKIFHFSELVRAYFRYYLHNGNCTSRTAISGMNDTCGGTNECNNRVGQNGNLFGNGLENEKWKLADPFLRRHRIPNTFGTFSRSFILNMWAKVATRDEPWSTTSSPHSSKKSCFFNALIRNFEATLM